MINIDTTYCVAPLAARIKFVPGMNSVHITDTAAMGGTVGTDAEFATRSGPPLWSPPV
ncbi:MAG: hypothetical protein ACTH2Q_01155 [Propionibacteriaceae bacterium]